eukprot:364594-Chlamydomonas_euryale.AAC.8
MPTRADHQRTHGMACRPSKHELTCQAPPSGLRRSLVTATSSDGPLFQAVPLAAGLGRKAGVVEFRQQQHAQPEGVDKHLQRLSTYSCWH